MGQSGATPGLTRGLGLSEAPDQVRGGRALEQAA
jgi:hypothetical protein